MARVISIVSLHLLKEHEWRRLFNRYNGEDGLNVLKKNKQKRSSLLTDQKRDYDAEGKPYQDYHLFIADAISGFMSFNQTTPSTYCVTLLS